MRLDVSAVYGEFMTTALRRPRAGKMIGGVCAAIAQRFGWDVTIVRVLTVASILLPGPQVLAYLVLWALIPREQ
ncbi:MULTISPECIES: PspC domain-containing protein [Mycobacteroides]|mgnify:CR=1 FL=1|jgi:phage shock protein PspC (stress-responsive transcriptional regulator)|uniref:Phage shock protein PspC N-terminal domain-containing protein n=1 Tax=Mycobacteroides chelonae TaxID=1774 RepID=A0A1S1LU24_MYCCH|nr:MULTISPECIES: PspC domain-containing protein [Mycobacteroides]KRQ26855.1 phage-shock protein [Mycobacteroides sp. H003]KRQ28711.1 phage-shock protein [Mycobacteroides sp. H092]KRQ44123.1 phage-shock protein [Mycobacteroides sp. H101]KRQ50992.1 phage-shock protein [Mycobacteroides sp. H063]KRQ57457.1 phage-shock protein [Mycobacteroides sp. HXVII]